MKPASFSKISIFAIGLLTIAFLTLVSVTHTAHAASTFARDHVCDLGENEHPICFSRQVDPPSLLPTAATESTPAPTAVDPGEPSAPIYATFCTPLHQSPASNAKIPYLCIALN